MHVLYCIDRQNYRYLVQGSDKVLLVFLMSASDSIKMKSHIFHKFYKAGNI